MVEMHVMEHGLIMLEGGGILPARRFVVSGYGGRFYLDGAVVPAMVRAIGKVPAKYLIYKDWNRHPLGKEKKQPSNEVKK